MYISCGNGGNVRNPSVLNAAQINGARSVATRIVRFVATPKNCPSKRLQVRVLLPKTLANYLPIRSSSLRDANTDQDPLISAEKSSLTAWGKMSEKHDVLFHNVNFAHYQRTTFSHTRGRVSFKIRFQHVEGRVVH